MEDIGIEFAVRIECVLLAEERDTIACVQEVVVARPLLLVRLEDGGMTVVVKVCTKHFCATHHSIGFFRRVKTLKDEKAVTLKLFKSLAHRSEALSLARASEPGQSASFPRELSGESLVFRISCRSFESSLI